MDTCPCPYRFGCRNVKSIDSTPLHPRTQQCCDGKKKFKPLFRVHGLSVCACEWVSVRVWARWRVCVSYACENKWCAYISLWANYMRSLMFARLLCEQISPIYLYIYRHLDAGPMKNRIVISFDDDQWLFLLLCRENGCSPIPIINYNWRILAKKIQHTFHFLQNIRKN